MGDLSPQESRVSDHGVSSDTDYSVIPGANTDTSFAKLPIELRLQIWHSCYPPRQDMHLRPPDTSYYKWQLRELPVTLWINNESRQETLRDFVFEVLKRNVRRGMQILCFRPNYDVLYFDCIHQMRKRPIKYNWLRDSLQKHPDWFSQVHTLEIRRLECAVSRSNSSILYPDVSVAFDCIALFPNLRNLRILEKVLLDVPFTPETDDEAAKGESRTKRHVTEEIQKRVNNMVGVGHVLRGLNISVHRTPALVLG